MKRKLFAVLSFGVLAACSSTPAPSDSPEAVSEPAPAKRYSAHSRRILILEGPLPASIKYEAVARVKVRTGGYRDAEQVLLIRLADRARILGADAVIDVQMWRQPAGWSWAAPHADGQAVKILNLEETGNLSKFGTLY